MSLLPIKAYSLDPGVFNKLYIQRLLGFLAHDEPGTCRTSLVSPEQPVRPPVHPCKAHQSDSVLGLGPAQPK